MKLTKKKKILQMKILFSQIRFRLDLTDVIQNEYKLNNEANKERTVHNDSNLSGGRKLNGVHNRTCTHTSNRSFSCQSIQVFVLNFEMQYMFEEVMGFSYFTTKFNNARLRENKITNPALLLIQKRQWQ